MLESPPSVPRSIIVPACHKNACTVTKSGKLLLPTTCPRSLIAVAPPPTGAARLSVAASHDHTRRVDRGRRAEVAARQGSEIGDRADHHSADRVRVERRQT